jgi:4'-phosphopantetheinyl transferase
MQSFESGSTWSNPPEVLNIQPDQVDIWRISLNLPLETVSSLGSALSADESLRAARFHSPDNRNRYITAHGCQREILARYLDCNPGQLRFSTNKHGKPALQGSELAFNLSHSGDFALLAVSSGRQVGIDVERIRPDKELERIAERFFSPIEVSELMALLPGQRLPAFFDCWTRKEAYIKAQGLGFSLPLDSFDVSLTPGQPASLRATRPNSHDAARWTMLSLTIDPGYAAAVAVSDSPISDDIVAMADVQKRASTENKLEFRLWNW